MNPLTETFELVHRAQTGDGEALNALCARYYERVRSAVRVRIGPELRQQVETADILQRTFLKACQIFDRFEMRDEGSLIHWLAKVAEGQIRDVYDSERADKRDFRKRIRLDGKRADGETAPIPGLPPADATAPIDAVVRDEDRHRLEAALDSLEPQHRDVIVLREFEGLSWADVAVEAGRPSPEAAQRMYAHALTELAKRLRQGESGP